MAAAPPFLRAVAVSLVAAVLGDRMVQQLVVSVEMVVLELFMEEVDPFQIMQLLQ